MKPKKWLIGLLTIPQTLSLIIKQNQSIMGKLEETLEKLQAISDKQDATLAGVAKIGTETDGLKAEIQSLKDVIANNPGVPQAIIDAVDAVDAKVNAVSAAVAEVDAKVPDAPVVTPDPETPTE